MNDKLICSLENPSIRKVLNDVLNQLDKKPFSQRTNNINIAINEKNFKELYEPSEELNDEYLEKDIENLVKEGLFSFSKNTKSFLPLIERNVKLIFNKDFENKIREFYYRNKIVDTWENALSKFNFDEELLEILKKSPIVIKTKSHLEVLEKFEIWVKSNKKSNSIRQESARCFWGMSKVFDNKYELCKYFNLLDKPILLQIHVKTKNAKDVLFIENLETFIACIESKNSVFDELILIFASGFKASAKRVRQKEGSKIFFSNTDLFDTKEKQEFLDWFYSNDNEKREVYFWGDLDYSGISILNSLKDNFQNLKAWEKAYSLMVKKLELSEAHRPNMVDKQNQKTVTNSSCKYTNEELIPSLNKTNLFLDQEIIELDLIK